jgi:hypothetical protein
MDPNQVAFKRPTTAVRIRPYLFRYESRVRTWQPGNLPIRLTPQGSPADGSRVSWGWNIKIIFEDPTQANTILFQGSQITFPIGTAVYELVNSTLNNGTDVTYYEISGVTGDFTLHTIEQILQVSAE